MFKESKILLMTKDTIAAGALHTTLENNENFKLTGVCREVSELTEQMSKMDMDTVIVDVDHEPHEVLNGLGTATAKYPDIRVLVLSSSFSNELILKAMHAGSRHFIDKKSIKNELVNILEQITPYEWQPEPKAGSIISVISASGGCGATTVAINVANEIRLATSEDVLVADMDSYYGTVSSYLGITGEYGIADVLSHESPIDEHLVRSCAYRYDENFHVLCSNASGGKRSTKQLAYENLETFLESCKKAYRYTVVDAPRLESAIVKELVSASEAVLVVFQLTVKDVMFARSLVTSLQTRIAPGRIIPLANRFKNRGSLVRMEDGQQVIGLNCFNRIRSDWRNAIDCINRGQPLSQVAPRSKLRYDFQKLAANLIKTNENCYSTR